MENKYTETEEKRVDLELEDLENVAGGIKWEQKNGGKGPRQKYASTDRPSFIMPDEDDKSGVNDDVVRYVVGYGDNLRGGIV